MLEEILNTPWKAWNESRRLAGYPAARLQFALAGVPWGKRWRVFGKPILQRHRNSTWQLGAGLELRSSAGSNPVGLLRPVILSTRAANAVLRIGDDCGLSGVSIVAVERVEIGHRVLLGANAVISDTDFHPLDPEARRRDSGAGHHAPVIIGDDVFVGMNALILKGVTIGPGSVVGAGSVVTRDVPEGAIVAGNPARIIDPVSNKST